MGIGSTFLRLTQAGREIQTGDQSIDFFGDKEQRVVHWFVCIGHSRRGFRNFFFVVVLLGLTEM